MATTTSARGRAALIGREGCRLKAYRDAVGVWTIGVGHAGPEVHAGLVWSAAQIDARLASDIAAVQARLDAELPWWRTLNDARQDVLVQLGFQLGVAGLLKFHTTLDAAEHGRFAQAAGAMAASAWARQTPARARRLAERMRTGEEP